MQEADDEPPLLHDAIGAPSFSPSPTAMKKLKSKKPRVATKKPKKVTSDDETKATTTKRKLGKLPAREIITTPKPQAAKKMKTKSAKKTGEVQKDQ